jgi:hypothetical protein
MDADEQLILDYLRSWPGQYVAAREIARRAGGKFRFCEDAQWAAPHLARLLEKGMVETDGLGHYRPSPKAASEPKKPQRWISPQLQHILANSGKDFTHLLDAPESDGFATSQPAAL